MCIFLIYKLQFIDFISVKRTVYLINLLILCILSYFYNTFNHMFGILDSTHKIVAIHSKAYIYIYAFSIRCRYLLKISDVILKIIVL